MNILELELFLQVVIVVLYLLHQVQLEERKPEIQMQILPLNLQVFNIRKVRYWLKRVVPAQKLSPYPHTMVLP